MDRTMDTTIRKILISRVKEIPNKSRVIEFTGSTETPDRDNEVIKAKAWQVDRYVKNPVVQWAHDYSSPPIGKTLSIRQNNKQETIFEIEFADKETYEFADTVYRLCKGGFLNATSVGFIPLEWDAGKKEGDPSRTFTKVELLEISIVPVPANPEALVSARNQNVISAKEFDALSKKPNKAAVMSQEAIKDEIDYMTEILKINTLNEDNQILASNLTKEIKRLTGCDKPEVIDKAAIRSLVRKVIKCNKAHHEAHNAMYDTINACMDEMKDLEDGDSGNQPDTPMGSAPQNLDYKDEIKKIFTEALNGNH